MIDSLFCRRVRPGLRRLRCLSLAACVAGCLQALPCALAAEALKASTSREARQDAAAAVPLDRLSAEERAVVEDVVKNPSIYRRLPTQVIDCDPHMFLFLIQHPEVVVNIWEVMQISDVTLARTGKNTFRANDGDGTAGNLKILHEAYDKHLVYAEGTYSGSMVVRPVQAKCVLLLRSAFIRETNGRQYVTCRLDAFLQLDRAGVELLAKTFQPLMGRAADYNFGETMAFVSSLSRTAEVNPRGTALIAHKLERVEPDVRNRLAMLAQQVAERATAGLPVRPTSQGGEGR